MFLAHIKRTQIKDIVESRILPIQFGNNDTSTKFHAKAQYAPTRKKSNDYGSAINQQNIVNNDQYNQQNFKQFWK